MITVIVIAFALCAIVLFYMVVRSRRRQAGHGVRPVDLAAFRTLMDRDDELFLRRKLPRSKFSHLKRQRIRVTFRYVTRIASNASSVMRMGEAERSNPVPEVAGAAAQVTELATQIRLQCLVAISKLALEYALPSLQFTPGMLAPKYQSLRDSVSRLGDLTHKPVPLAAAI